MRPSVLEPDIEPIIDVPPHPAYPSGHSTQLYFFAYVLSELVPSEREGFLEKAARVAKNREIAGVHYPSDTEAGRMLARQFVDLLFQNAEFNALFEQARTEWSTETLF